MEKQYFLCHSDEDSKLAESLKEELESNGYKCWISTKLTNQPDREKITNKALVESDIVILMFTENTSACRTVRTELDIAANQRIPILTLEFQKSEISESIAYYTQNQKWIDCKLKQEYTPEILKTIFDISKSKKNDLQANSSDKNTTSWWKIASIPAILFLIILAICNNKPLSDSPINLFNITVGNLNSWDYASDACRTINGDYLVAGGWDWGYWNKIWVTRLNENGELISIWADSITGECQPQILPCEDNGCVLVYADLSEVTSSSVVIRSVKFDSSNRIVWQRQLEVPVENAKVIQLTNLKWVQIDLLSASFAVELLGGNQHIILNTIIDSNTGEGSYFTLNNPVDSHRMAITPNGDLLNLAHLSEQTENIITITTPEGENISEYFFSDNCSPLSIACNSGDSSLLIARTTGGINGILSIVKLSDSFEVQWENTFDNELTGTFTELVILNNENILIAGSTSPEGNNETDGRLICLNKDGELIWETTIDNNGDDKISSIYISEDTSILLTGTTTKFGNRDGWFLSLSSEGEFIKDCTLGFDILFDDFELEFVNRDCWDIQLNQNNPAVTANIHHGNGHALNIQSGLIVQKNAVINTIGLVFSAELSLPREILANDSNWISFGTSEVNLANMVQPDSKIPDAIFQVNLTPSENVFLETSRTDPDTSSILYGLSLMNNLQTHLIEIESQEDSIFFSADGNILFKTATTTRPDSLYFFIHSNAQTVSYDIDNIRIYQKSW